MRIEGRGGGAAGDEWAILGTPHGAHLARARTVQNGGEEVRESVLVGVVPQRWARPGALAATLLPCALRFALFALPSHPPPACPWGPRVVEIEIALEKNQNIAMDHFATWN